MLVPNQNTINNQKSQYLTRPFLKRKAVARNENIPFAKKNKLLKMFFITQI